MLLLLSHFVFTFKFEINILNIINIVSVNFMTSMYMFHDVYFTLKLCMIGTFLTKDLLRLTIVNSPKLYIHSFILYLAAQFLESDFPFPFTKIVLKSKSFYVEFFFIFLYQHCKYQVKVRVRLCHQNQ